MPKSSIVRLFLRVSPEIFETILFFDNQASLIAYIESAGAGEGNRQLGPCGLAREVGDYVFGEGRALDFRCDRGGAQVNGFFLACVGNTRYFHFEGGHFGGEAGFVHQDSHLAFAVGNQFEESFPVGERGARGDRRDGRGAEESMLAVTVPSLIEVFSVAYVYPSGSSGVGSGSPVQPSEQLLKAAEASREKGRRNVKNFFIVWNFIG